MEATVSNGKKELYRDFGEMLFTHFGVSGPLMLSASSFCAKAIAKNPLKLSIDLNQGSYRGTTGWSAFKDLQSKE